MDLRLYLKSAGMKQRDLAQRIGVSEAALSKVLSGKQTMTAAVALSIAEALKVDPGVVLRASLAQPQPEQAA